MRIPLALALGLAATVVTGCGTQPQASPPAAPVTVTKTATPEAAAGAATSTPSSTPSKAPVKRVRVPRVVGMNHQAAQNLMQDRGLFKLREVDATGQGRMLLWDRNWVVVKQKPAAGTRVTENATITLYSKKIGE